MEITQDEMKELSRLMGEGYTGGRLDIEQGDGTFKYITWSFQNGTLTAEAWTDED